MIWAIARPDPFPNLERSLAALLEPGKGSGNHLVPIGPAVVARPFFVEVVEAEFLDRAAEARVLRVEGIFSSAALVEPRPGTAGAGERRGQLKQIVREPR